MAEIKQIKVGSTSYDIRDTSKIPYNDTLQTTNPFGGKYLYISKIDDALYVANKRWTITGSYTDGVNTTSISASQLASLFDGSYESTLYIPKASSNGVYTATIRITFDTGSPECDTYSDVGVFPGYPYGYVYISYYYTGTPYVHSTVNVYCNYEPHTKGVHNITCSNYTGSYASSASASAGTSGLVEVARQSCYAISYLELVVTGQQNYAVGVSEIELKLDRPASSRTPFLSKYGSEILYNDLTLKQNLTVSGTINGNATSATKATQDASGNTITSTYATKAELTAAIGDAIANNY